MATIKKQVAAVAHDLLNLEVNTIIKSDILGCKMPDPRHALIDIARDYTLKLTALGFPPETADTAQPAAGDGDAADESAKIPTTQETFENLRKAAKASVAKMEEKAKGKDGLTVEEEADLALLYRIEAMSNQIKGIFNALQKREKGGGSVEFHRDGIEEGKQKVDFSADEVGKIRKIWEMGMAEIAMQTVIQLDGDVITAIQPQYADAKNSELHRIHQTGVDTSMKFWRGLIDIVQTSLESILKIISGGK